MPPSVQLLRSVGTGSPWPRPASPHPSGRSGASPPYRLALLGCVVVLAAVGCSGALPWKEAQAFRSAVLITVDTLRADHLSAYGYPVPTSPSMDRFMARGVRFQNALSPSPSTGPAHASMLTGRYPGFHSIGMYNGHYRLLPRARTVAELAAAAGLATAAIVSNPILARSSGLDQGFHHYDDRFEGTELNRQMRERYADVAVDLALAALDRLRDGPFFLWLHLQDPHGPYAPPEGWDPFGDLEYPRGETMLPLGDDHSGYQAIPRYQVYGSERRYGEYVRRYDSEIAFADHELGRFLRALQEDRFRETLVILTADHGEAMGEGDFYFAHGHSVGLDQVAVPLALVGPGIPEGRVVLEPVSTVAVFDTLVDHLGLGGTEISPERTLLRALQQRDGGEGTGSWEPVFVESLNQVGVAYDNGFLRIDRRPADDKEFWSLPNINTGGTWRPLGRELVQPLDPRLPPAQTDLEGLMEILTAFDVRAAAASRELDPLREPIVHSEEVLELLRSLGYVR